MVLGVRVARRSVLPGVWVEERLVVAGELVWYVLVRCEFVGVRRNKV